MVFVFAVFSSLVLGHIINNGLQIKLRMSKSHRHLNQPRDLPNSTISYNSIAAHIKNTTNQTRNFSHLMQRGRQLYYSNQMAHAIQYLQRGLYYDPSNQQINFMLGMSHITLGNLSQGVRHLNKVAKQNPKYKSNLFLLLAIAHNKIGNNGQAMQSVDRYVADNQDNVQGLFYRAKLYIKNNKYMNAIGDIEKILEKMPKHGPSLLLKVRCLLIQGKLNDALAVIAQSKKQLQQIDKQQQLRLQQAKIYLQTNQIEQGLICLRQIQNQFVIIQHQLHIIRGKLLQRAGRSQQAIIVYNQLLQKNISSRQYCQVISEIAIYYMKERDFYEAFTYLKRTTLMKVRSKPTDNLLKLAEGVTFLMKKKYAQAILLIGSCQLDYHHSLAEYSNYLYNLYYNSLAFGNFSLGNHDQALQLYRKISTNDPFTDKTGVQYNIAICQGIIQYIKNNHQQAIRCFERAYIQVTRPEPYFYIAVILNEEYMKDSMNSQGFVKILDIIEKGLKAGESAHMYYYKAIIYLFLGMNAQALEDIDKAIQKSQDNVARYFHARGIVFMLDKNYEQAIMEFSTALSIDDHIDDSAIQKGKCQLMSGDSQTAYLTIQGLKGQQEWRTFFQLYEKDYTAIIEGNCNNENTLQICNFMLGKFDQAGPSGKLIIAILYENYGEVINLIEEAVTLGVSVGCLQTNDLLILKAFSQYKLMLFEESILTLIRVQRVLKQANSKNETYCEQDQRKLLLCKVNIILINYRRNHQIQALQLTQQLLSEVCDGPITDQLYRLKQFLLNGDPYQISFLFDSQMINDYFATEQYQSLRFKFLIPLPHYRVIEVEFPHYQQLMTDFKVGDIENKPEAPWIKRGQFGVMFTNDIKQFQNLNLRTEENQGSKSKIPSGSGSRIISTRSKLMKDLKLSNSVLDKLQKIANRNKEQP